jgi:hypothetical protein
MPSIRKAIEALADGLRNRRAADGSAYECGLQNQAQSVARLLSAILSAHPEPSREELREKVKAAIMPLVVDYGADMGDQTNEDMANEYTDRILALLPPDLTDATLPDMPTSKRTVTLNGESLREALRKIIEWCDGTRGADIGKGPFESIEDCARAALSRAPAPQSVTMTQPKIDFVLDLSQAEADRLGPPMRHRCAIDPGWHNMTANCFGIKEIEEATP